MRSLGRRVTGEPKRSGILSGRRTPLPHAPLSAFIFAHPASCRGPRRKHLLADSSRLNSRQRANYLRSYEHQAVIPNGTARAGPSVSPHAIRQGVQPKSALPTTRGTSSNPFRSRNRFEPKSRCRWPRCWSARDRPARPPFGGATILNQRRRSIKFFEALRDVVPQPPVFPCKYRLSILRVRRLAHA